MSIEQYRLLAAVIAAHPDRRVCGRTRLQKEVKLLQSLKFPTNYSFTLHFYGPYSQGLYAEIGLLEALRLVTEEQRQSATGLYYILEAPPEAARSEVAQFQHHIDRMAQAEIVALELAATYDAFRSTGVNHDVALTQLRRKKGTKCAGENEALAFRLLSDLGLPFN